MVINLYEVGKFFLVQINNYFILFICYKKIHLTILNIIMRIGFMNVGTEILIGDTLNTNGSALSRILLSQGFILHYDLSVADDKDDVASALKFLTSNVDVLIISGGLGPTEDDMTKEYLSSITGYELIEDLEHTEWMRNRWRERGMEMSEINKKQSFIFNNFNKIPNTAGTALGATLNFNNTDIYLTPGPPREFIPMVEDYVINEIKDKYQGNNAEYKYLTIYGIPESTLSENIDTFKPKDIELAYLPSYGIIKLRYNKNTVTDKQEKILLTGIKKDYKDNLISYANKSLEYELINELSFTNRSISLIESITGGKLSANLVAIPGASKVFKQSKVLYQNDQKKRFLDSEELEEDWELLTLLLANKIIEESDSSMSLSVLGEAGPISSSRYKVGDVFIAVCDKERSVVNRYKFTGNRQDIINQTCNQCLFDLLKFYK